jgi:hypothetical protein
MMRPFSSHLPGEKKEKKRESGKKYNYFGEDELILTSFLLRFCFLTLLKV